MKAPCRLQQDEIRKLLQHRTIVAQSIGLPSFKAFSIIALICSRFLFVMSSIRKENCGQMVSLPVTLEIFVHVFFKLRVIEFEELLRRYITVEFVISLASLSDIRIEYVFR